MAPTTRSALRSCEIQTKIPSPVHQTTRLRVHNSVLGNFLSQSTIELDDTAAVIEEMRPARVPDVANNTTGSSCKKSFFNHFLTPRPRRRYASGSRNWSIGMTPSSIKRRRQVRRSRNEFVLPLSARVQFLESMVTRLQLKVALLEPLEGHYKRLSAKMEELLGANTYSDFASHTVTQRNVSLSMSHAFQAVPPVDGSRPKDTDDDHSSVICLQDDLLTAHEVLPIALSPEPQLVECTSSSSDEGSEDIWRVANDMAALVQRFEWNGFYFDGLKTSSSLLLAAESTRPSMKRRKRKRKKRATTLPSPTANRLAVSGAHRPANGRNIRSTGCECAGTTSTPPIQASNSGCTDASPGASGGVRTTQRRSPRDTRPPRVLRPRGDARAKASGRGPPSHHSNRSGERETGRFPRRVNRRSSSATGNARQDRRVGRDSDQQDFCNFPTKRSAPMRHGTSHHRQQPPAPPSRTNSGQSPALTALARQPLMPVRWRFEEEIHGKYLDLLSQRC